MQTKYAHLSSLVYREHGNLEQFQYAHLCHHVCWKLKLLARIGRGEGPKYYREEEILVRSNSLGLVNLTYLTHSHSGRI